MGDALQALANSRKEATTHLNHRVNGIMALPPQTTAYRAKLCESRLDSAFESFAKINNKITGKLSGENLTVFVTENSEFEDLYMEAKVKVNQFIPDERNETENRPNRTTDVRMPRIEIPYFSGTFEDWGEFKDLFQSCVVDTDMPQVQKLQFLKTRLKGDAALQIKNLKMREANFNVAWERLTEHYENTRKIVNSYLSRFFAIKPITQSTTAQGIQDMIVTTNDMLTSLIDQGVDTESWNAIVVFVLSQKLDSYTLNRWHETLKNDKSISTFTKFQEFLETRKEVHESYINRQRSAIKTQTVSRPKEVKALVNKTEKLKNAINYKCYFCNETHRTYTCKKFIDANDQERLKMAENKQLCLNCLHSHKGKECFSKFMCQTCNHKHHSLLHNALTKLAEASSNGTSAKINLCFNNTPSQKRPMLATALVKIKAYNGEYLIFRALLDSGSEASIITHRAQQLLRTPRSRENCAISTIGENIQSTLKFSTKISLRALNGDFSCEFSALIAPKITTISHQLSTLPCEWTHLQNLQLADPKFNEQGQIDLLLGVQEVALIMMENIKRGPADSPIAQETKVGWILYGGYLLNKNIKCHLNTTSKDSLSECISKFWELENIPNVSKFSPEEQLAENLFSQTVKRMENGHLMVELPFKINPESNEFLGSSYTLAVKRFMLLEQKLKRNIYHHDEYHKCINEYIEMGHTHEIPNTEQNQQNGYFMPHHAVIKQSSETTKLRVVFDASCKTSNGISLNDRLCVGPTIQKNLFELLIEWRKFEISITGDIEKMYRMIHIADEHSKYQKILWRDSENEAIKQYALNTVTFGTASAPFQAIRALFKIADDIQTSQPITARLIKNNFYVDDFLGSFASIEEAEKAQVNLSKVLSKYGFNIRKWKSNSIEFLNNLKESEKSKENIAFNSETKHKTLGVLWLPQRDLFSYTLNFNASSETNTKRKILSEIAQLFDPLGWIAPAIVKAKIFMQNLWRIEKGWDDMLSTEIVKEWQRIRNQLLKCSEIEIPRWLGLNNNEEVIQLHGFADASEKAFAAAVYLRIITNGKIQTNLIAAKTKVAPMKPKLTIPRMELMAAVLLSELITKIQGSFESNLQIYAWSDSMDTLNWIAATPDKWKTFVANRVSQIQEMVPIHLWHHIPGEINPADCASRGLYLNELKTHDLWWHGPQFLRGHKQEWPSVTTNPNHDLEIRKIKIFLIQNDVEEIFNRFSDLTKAIKTIAICYRWIPSNKNYRKKSISAEEFNNALAKGLKVVQRASFSNDYEKLSKKGSCLKKIKLKTLNPFVDEQGLIRIRGRLQNADFPDTQKRSIILPHDAHLSKLIIRDTHKRLMHGGNQLTLQTIRQSYWLLRGKSTVKNEINRCIICFKHKQQTQTQQMGNLPPERVRAFPPFYNTGVDFAGFFNIKQSERRNAPFIKAYVSIFVCLSTKCVHLEAVTSLSTEAFLAAFKRFIARKSLPRNMYSDRGTNFIGARNELPRLLQNTMSEQTLHIQRELLKDNIQWHFIPAHAPHFGGIWEAAVKSFKHHLKRTINNEKLTFEEFSTVVAQIESCLNSRPLYTLNEDQEDYDVITPNHLFTGFPSRVLPEPMEKLESIKSLDRYHLVKALNTKFWNQWSQEYLQHMQKRMKWLTKKPNMKVGQIVFVKEDNLPPSKWLMGKIEKIYMGSDEMVRVVDVKCKDSILNRPIHKLCVLPIIDNQ